MNSAPHADFQAQSKGVAGRMNRRLYLTPSSQSKEAKEGGIERAYCLDRKIHFLSLFFIFIFIFSCYSIWL